MACSLVTYRQVKASFEKLYLVAAQLMRLNKLRQCFGLFHTRSIRATIYPLTFVVRNGGPQAKKPTAATRLVEVTAMDHTLGTHHSTNY